MCSLQEPRLLAPRAWCARSGSLEERDRVEAGVAAYPEPMRVIETEPGVRWVARDGSCEAGAFVGRLHRTHAWLSLEDDVPPTTVRTLAGAAAGWRTAALGGAADEMR